MALLKGKITGKVMSGHPYVTSTGNALRCVSYMKFMEKKSQKIVPSLKIYLNQDGDDGFHWVFWKKEETPKETMK